ncbi:PIN domain-containing protein [Streptomyces sp. NPDC059916]|uniref:PIN domain-containing protein n=1 Tax=Streptomyces sp. NPDC059916 TaxID=3347001 RepID=UPI0036C7ACB5
MDTSILRSFNPESSSADLLRAIRATGAHRVAVPWVVMEELAAQQAIKYRDKHEKALRAVSALNEITPWAVKASAGPCEWERFAEHWRARWAKIVDTIPTSNEALREAALREMNNLPPCKKESNGQKTGGRDAAIWLSAIEYAREHPDETVYFASANTKDFGTGAVYETPMSDDLTGLGDRFRHWTSLDEALEEFAKPTQGDRELAFSILKGKTAHTQIRTALRDHIPVDAGASFCLAFLDGGTEVTTVMNYWAPGIVRLIDFQEPHFYSMGSREWCMAEVGLQHSGMTDGGGAPSCAALALRTTILFALNEDDPGLTVLRASPSAPVERDVFEDLWTSERLAELSGDEALDLVNSTASRQPGLRRRYGIPRAYEGAVFRRADERNAFRLGMNPDEGLKRDVPPGG